MVMDVISGHGGNAQFLGQIDESAVSAGVALHQVLLQLHKHVARAEPVQVLLELCFCFGEPTFGQKTGHSACAASSQQNQTADVLRQVL